MSHKKIVLALLILLCVSFLFGVDVNRDETDSADIKDILSEEVSYEALKTEEVVQSEEQEHEETKPEEQEDEPVEIQESIQPEDNGEPVNQADAASLQAQEIISEMSLHEKICQLFIVFPETITNVSAVQAAGSVTEQALEKWPVGGFIYDKKNLQNREQVYSMLTGVQNYAKIPLILTCDEEGGRVNRLMSTVNTTYIGPMLDYKDEGVEVAKENAKTIATDMVSCGFNTDLAPVADVWSNPENTVIGDRAYSDDFEQAAELVAAAVEGFHEAGIVATLKHFPGHGNTSADSHYGAVYVDFTLDELRENELIPFQAGIDAGADMVMIGHLILPDIDSEPAPFSYKIVTELLREEMGFEGVVMTDALQMKAMTDGYGSGEIAVKAIQAGVDILLCPADFEAAVSAVTQAVESGAISQERIDESLERIIVLKIKNGFFDE